MPHSSGGGSSSGGSHSGGSHSSGGGSSSETLTSRHYRSGDDTYVYFDKHNNLRKVYSKSDISNISSISFISSKISILFYIMFHYIWLLVFIRAFGLLATYNEPVPLTIDYNDSIVFEDEYDLVDNDDDVIKSMTEFKDNTGITPALIIVKDSDWNAFYNSIEVFSYMSYTSRFDDEKHWVVTYSVNDENYSVWSWHGTIGDDTTELVGSQKEKYFSELMQDNLYKQDRIGLSNSFINTYNDMSSYLMKELTNEQKMHNLIVSIIGISLYTVVPFILLLGFIVGCLNKRKEYQGCVKFDGQVKDEDIDIGHCTYCDGTYIRGKHLTCPHCGAPTN